VGSCQWQEPSSNATTIEAGGWVKRSQRTCRTDRPPARTDALFLRSRAPFRTLSSHTVVSILVANAIRRAGIKRPGQRAAAYAIREPAHVASGSASSRDRGAVTTQSRRQIYAKIAVRGPRSRPAARVSPVGYMDKPSRPARRHRPQQGVNSSCRRGINSARHLT
jgi:hypothetical protein